MSIEAPQEGEILVYKDEADNLIEESESSQFEIVYSENHLKEGIPGITTHLGGFRSFQGKVPGFLSHEEKAFSVPWGEKEGEKTLDDKKIKHSGEGTYSISPIDERSKYSVGYGPCVGIVIVGRSAISGKEISSLSHLELSSVLFFNRDEFIRHFRQTCKEMSQISGAGSIDAVTFGGTILEEDAANFKDEYESALGLCGDITEQVLGFRPTSAVRPKDSVTAVDSAFFSNQDRQLYIERLKL
jgi:hypothetical protein